jgi:hypothetical protein
MQQVSASAQEMNAQVEEVTAATHTLGEMADSLQKQVSQFRVNSASSGNGKKAPTPAAQETVEAGEPAT